MWKRGGLAPESRAALKAIYLHWHDLRHEGASRLLEKGCPLHHISEMLGHADISQTATYLNVKLGGVQESMRRSDEARSRCNSVAISAAEQQRQARDGEQGSIANALLH